MSKLMLSPVKALLSLLLVMFTFGSPFALAEEQQAEQKQTAANPWKQVRERNGVTVFNRRIPGIAFKEFMAETVVEADLHTLIAVFNDAPAGVEWVENVDEMRQLDQLSENETITYTYSKAPWPVSDRDAVVHNRITQDPRTLAVTIQQRGVPEHIAKVKGAVRVPSLSSSWIFTPQDDGTTHVRYQVLTNPGGNLPAWLINAVSVSQPYKTLRGLQEIVLLEQYQNVEIAFIENGQGK
ncbi:START domain-containing protein [Aliagarivorans marinus]|uniref:START domain-containing protein n=1 Tax=Aliagarivorans marinus TaxID=561965 RepID=UPI000400177C|nr:START domain-containing protein [Aliagarivorans marinus]